MRDSTMEMTESHVEGRDSSNNERQDEAVAPSPDPEAMMEAALAWVEENQTLAMLGAFALGVFIGTLMRD